MKTLYTVLVSLMLTESASVAVTCYEGISYYEDLSKGKSKPCKNKVNRPPKTTACKTKPFFQGVCGWYVAKELNSDGCYAVVGYCSQKSTTSACESNVHARAFLHGNEYKHYNTFGRSQNFEVERNSCCSSNDCNFEALEKPKEAKPYVAKSDGVGTTIGIIVFIVIIAIIIGVCVLLNYLRNMAKHKKKMAKKMFKHQQQQLAMQHQQQQMAMHQQQQQMHAMNQFNQPVSTQPVMVKPVVAAGTVQPVGVVGVVGQPMGVPQTQAVGAPVVVSAQPQYPAQTAPVVVSAQPQYPAQPVAVAAVPSTQKSAACAPVTVVATAL